MASSPPRCREFAFKSSLFILLVVSSFILNFGSATAEEPTYSDCRVHIEAAIKGIATDDQPPTSTLLAHPDESTVEESLSEEPPLTEPEPLEATGEEEQSSAEEDHHPVTSHDEEEEEEVEANEDEPEPEIVEEADEHEEEEHADEEDEPQEEEEEHEEEDHVKPEIHEEEEEHVEEASVVEEPSAPKEPEVASEPIVEEPVAVTPHPEPQVVEEAPVTAESAPTETQATAPVDDPAEGIIEEPPAEEERRSRDHINQILRLDLDAENDKLRENVAQNILKDVKKLVENSVRSLENIFKYNDVSNRNFGDPEIFSKPLVLFLGPWSGGKSSIINYLLGTEFTQNALKTGAEPSATFFQILMHGETEEMLDGTQLAADWTFSGLQKFGQAFIDRLRGKRLPSKLLEKCNIVEVPGILEVRKQVDRPYPFNDVVQWFIDRADIIFVVYDPTKLDTGLEHEALFDQLKGRQNQVRVLLNKADSVTQEELLLIQNNLVWNLSPLMASPLPPTLYAGSYWSRPYKPDAPVRLLRAHEENMLVDLRDTLTNVVENTIAEARRHAVRVRNHAKMVDCYLTTFLNQKGYFGNKKAVADDIVENPHAYHIFEGLSTLNNISRYDLPDSDVYKDFFRLHKLYDFKPLASTCTFFRGCPLDKLDTAIAYELPELVGKYKKKLQSIASAAASKKTGH